MMNDDEKPPPKIRLAAENDAATIRTNQALQEVEFSLRKLAANLMRVARGAGKSYEIGPDCSDVIKAFHLYREAAGQWPSAWELEKALAVEDPMLKHYDSDHWEFYDARDQIIRAGLRTAAARLLKQNLQISAGEMDLATGMRELQQAQARLAAKMRSVSYSDLKVRRAKAAKNPWDED